MAERRCPRFDDPNVRDVLLEALADRCTIADACAIAGVAERTYHAWRERAEAGEADFAAFFAAVGRARAEARREAIRRIRLAGDDDWRADAWYLERSCPAEWGRTTKLQAEVTGKDGGPLVVAFDDALKKVYGDPPAAE